MSAWLTRQQALYALFLGPGVTLAVLGAFAASRTLISPDLTLIFNLGLTGLVVGATLIGAVTTGVVDQFIDDPKGTTP